jgi:hypothetical protein
MVCYAEINEMCLHMCAVIGKRGTKDAKNNRYEGQMCMSRSPWER